MHILIFRGHACGSTWLQIVLVCIDVNFILGYVTIGSYFAQANQFTHLQLFTREQMTKKCQLPMSLHMLQSSCNYLKRFLSQHLSKQFRSLHKVHFSKSSFLGKNIGDFTEFAIMKKKSVL